MALSPSPVGTVRRCPALLPCVLAVLALACGPDGRQQADGEAPPPGAPAAPEATVAAATGVAAEPATTAGTIDTTGPTAADSGPAGEPTLSLGAPPTGAPPTVAPSDVGARLASPDGNLLELRPPPPLPADLSVAPPSRSLPPGPIATVAPITSPPDPHQPPVATLNERILRLVDGYPVGPAHSYGWERGEDTDGTSVDLIWQGVPLALADSDGSVHCSGITFEVYLRALADALPAGAPAPTAAQLQSIKERWYIRDGNDEGPVDALVQAGLGWRVPSFDDLQPGDLVQFWRNSGKGHTAVFMRRRVTGDPTLQSMAYWSAQATSEGLGVRFKSVGDAVDQIAAGRLYGVRAIVPGS